MSGKFITGKNGTVEDVILNAPAEPVGGTPREIFYLPRDGYAGSQPAVWLDDWRRAVQRAEKAEREVAGLRADAERYRKLKAAITVPMAMQSFIRHMNWHPDTFKMGIDEAIDAARQEERKEGK